MQRNTLPASVATLESIGGAPWVRVRLGVHRAQQRALHFQRSGAEPQRTRWKLLLLFALLLKAINNNIVPAYT